MKNEVNSISLGQKSVKMDAAIEAMEARNGAEPPRGPKPEAAASNSTAITVLKQAIEWTQAHASIQAEIVRQQRLQLQESESLLRTMQKREANEARSLYLVAWGSGMDDLKIGALFHEMNLDCENVECEPCSKQYRPEWRE